MNLILKSLFILVAIGSIFFVLYGVFSPIIVLDDIGKNVVKICEQRGLTYGSYTALQESGRYEVSCGTKRYVVELHDVSDFNV